MNAPKSADAKSLKEFGVEKFTETLKSQKDKIEVVEKIDFTDSKAKSEKEQPEKVKSDKEQPEKLKPEKEKLEHKEIEKVKPEKEGKLEVKEIEKVKRDDEKPLEKLDKEVVEGGLPGAAAVNPAQGLDTAELLRHADSLEESGLRLRHFIEQSLRPDLGEGALRNEDDLKPEDDDA